MLSISTAALQFGMNPSKPFFPVNSLRLFYLMITDTFFPGNIELVNKVNQLIPAVEAVLNFKPENKETNQRLLALSDTDLQSLETTLQPVFALVHTPELRQSFTQFFIHYLPTQKGMFSLLYEDLVNHEKLGPIHLQMLLRARALDSILFSSAFGALLNQTAHSGTLPAFPLPNTLPAALDFSIHLAYQINDIVDTVVYAKDDFDKQQFSPFQLITKIAPEAAQAKELIKNTLDTLLDQGKTLTVSEPLSHLTREFYQELARVIVGSEVETRDALTPNFLQTDDVATGA